MSDKLTQEKFDRAVLVGLNAFSMSQEENATEETMEELTECWSELQSGPEQDGPSMNGMTL